MGLSDLQNQMVERFLSAQKDRWAIVDSDITIMTSLHVNSAGEHLTARVSKRWPRGLRQHCVFHLSKWTEDASHSRICIPAPLCCSLMADECSCVRKRFVKSFSVAHEYFLGFIFSLLLLLSVILAASNVGHLSTTHPLFSVTFMAESEAGVFTLPQAKGNL